jgi:N-acyl homoserine lactone hydrolase
MGVRKLYVLPLGLMEHDIGVLLDGKSGSITSPIAAYLIKTDDNWVLYDTGADPDVVEDPENIWKGIIKIIKPTITPSDNIVQRLKEINLEPDDIDYVVQSHLHLDHAGGLRFFKQAKIIVHRDEYRFAYNPHPYFKSGYKSKDFDYPDLNWTFIEGDQLLVPGVTIVLTGGHTPGHISLVVDLEDQGTLVLAGDAIPLQANLDKMILSGTTVDPVAAYQSMLRLKAIADRSGGDIWPYHDIALWEKLKKSPEFYR